MVSVKLRLQLEKSEGGAFVDRKLGTAPVNHKL